MFRKKFDKGIKECRKMNSKQLFKKSYTQKEGQKSSFLCFYSFKAIFYGV